MRKPRLRPPVRRTRRRWRVPPAITHGSEAFEGAGILEEIPGKLGLLLWQSVRDVTLWAGTPAEAREGLFTPGAERERRAALQTAAVDPALEPALARVAEILGRPNATTGELMARACHRVAEWADERDLTATAIAFVQAAALAAPLDADTACTLARLARRRAEHARAETWFRRAIALARQSGDWSAYSLAFLGLGNLYVLRGSFPVARRFYVRALRAARRHSLHALAGMTFHDLFVLAVASGRPHEAERAAREAHREYGRDHPRLRALAHDVACFWMEQGHPARALSVFRALLPRVTRPAERLVALANLAGAGEEAERAVRAEDPAAREADAFAEALVRSLDEVALTVE